MSNRIKNEKPLPCPFCGNKDVRLKHAMLSGEIVHFVICGKCGANGSLGLTAIHALRGWNHRVDVEKHEDIIDG